MTEQDDLGAENSRVLVAVMNNLRDFDIARTEGWYRIPFDRAPSRLGADYLAFYHTKVFRKERWAVNYYAPTKRFRIVPRRHLLPDEPDHPRAEEAYYKIEIGALERLPHPVPSQRLRRITFIPTTLERLLRAEEINDLWCGDAAEEKLYQAFKENGISAERYYPIKEEDQAYRLDLAIFCKEGRIGVLVEGDRSVENIRIVRERPTIGDYDLVAHGWTPLRFTVAELNDRWPDCLAAALSAVAEYGRPLPPPNK